MLKDLRAAFVTATLSVAYSLSTSALIFTGPIQKLLGLGMISALVTATASALITSLGSGFRIAIASPTSTIAAGLAVTIASLDPILATLPNSRSIPLVFGVLAITTLATGSVLVLIGLGKLGKIIRFIPFPVVAGFMATSGWLLASGALRMTLEIPSNVNLLSALFDHANLIKIVMVVVWAAFLAIMTDRYRKPATMPWLLIGGVVAINLIQPYLDISFGTVQIRDLMFHADANLASELPFFSDMRTQFDWQLLGSLAPSIMGVMFITVLTALLTCTGLENALDVDGDLDHEMKVQGAANIVSGFGGGYVGLISVGTTMAARSAGASGRMAGAVTALVCLSALLGGIHFVNDIPRFIVGGLQLEIGAQIMWVWCVAIRKRMPLVEWLLVLVILSIAIGFGFVPAILSGILGGCIIFAIDVSRINVIRRVYAINERGSALVRSADEIAVLSKEGGSAKVVEVSGYVFFGSAYQILSLVKDQIATGELGLLILDFTSVSGGDSSAVAILNRLNRLLARSDIELIFAGINPDVKVLLRNSGMFDDSAKLLPDRDQALRYAENLVLARVGTPAPSTISIKTWLAVSLGSVEHANALLPYLQCTDIPADTYLCRQGEPTNELLFIESGRVGVIIEGAEGEQTTVRTFGAHTIAGEQGFILNQPRSASLKAETDTRIWILQRDVYDRLMLDNPELVIALMRDIVRVQSERLRFATREAAALSQ